MNEEALIYEEDDALDIRELIGFFFSKLWLVIVLALLGGAIGFAYSSFAMPVKYESYTTMYVKNVNQTTAQDPNTNVDLNDLNTSKSLVNTYIAVLKSNAVMEEVGKQLLEIYDINDLGKIFPMANGNINIGALKKCFTMSSVDNTEVMKISCVTLNPSVSADMCNILADLAPGFLIRVVGAGSVEVIDVAAPNDIPVSPNIPKITIIGAAGGFMIACLIIFLMFSFDDTVKDTELLSRKYSKAILGEVQSVDGERKRRRRSGEARALLTEQSIPFNVVESYKSIRSNILFTLGTSDKNIVAVSSPNPGEGKSTTAANIAVAFAQTGASVLLIDADLRKPVQHKTFKVKNTEGLSTLIIKRTDFEQSVKRNVIKGLDLLSAGPMPPNPSELLASENFSRIMSEFAQNYDYVVIDTPPINVVSDAMVIKDSISGILVVLRYGVTTEDEVANCMRQVDIAKANMLGFVLNDIYHRRGSSYYNYKYKYKKYGYDGYGYGYGRRAPAEDGEDDAAD